MSLFPSKRWFIRDPNPERQVLLSNALDIHPIVAQLLINRGIQTIEEAQQFLSADLRHLHDPFLLTDMSAAVERIYQARDNNEIVMVFGDYDVDGVTSSVILNRLLRRLDIRVIHYIPHRIHEGYGLNHEIAPFAKEQGVSLLIAVDCGITAHREVETLKEAGIDVIIFDHHEPLAENLPKAKAVVNPKRLDCPYPFKNLASVGLMAKLAHAILGGLHDDFLDLVTLGTIADVVPLQGENRIFVKHGLPKINETQNIGLCALLDVARIRGRPMQPYYVGFILGPRINATGRMDSAQKSLQLLLSEREEEAYALAQLLEEQNSLRQKMQKYVLEEALEIVNHEINFKHDRVIVVAKEGWHKGVLGIVASQIMEMYYRPTIVISLEEGLGTASARSIDGFHLHEALTHCATLLEGYGGHKLAAGLTIREENIETFTRHINEFASTHIQEEDLMPTLKIDSEIPLSNLNLELVKTINILEPYGEENPAPVFCSRNLMIKGPAAVVGKETIKFWVSDGQSTLSVVGFGMAKYREAMSLGQKIDLAYQPVIDDWNKEPIVQLKLKDIRES